MGALKAETRGEFGSGEHLDLAWADWRADAGPEEAMLANYDPGGSFGAPSDNWEVHVCFPDCIGDADAGNCDF